MSATELSIQPLHAAQFSELYVEHNGWLQAWLRKKLRCSQQAADVAHDTFVQVLASHRVQEIVEPRAYLTTLAQRVLFNVWRRRDLEKAYLVTLAELPESVVPSLEDRALLLEVLSQIDTVLQTVSKQGRHVFLLNQLQDLTYREISIQLDMPLITVRRHMQRAIRACYLALHAEQCDA
jgi:RNA polymerase sigma-19 factor, ECF subfamily